MIAISAICVSAQKATKFTSIYTNLDGKTCKFYAGGDGQDGMSLCKGPGKYQVRIYSSATMTHIVAELKGDSSENYGLANVKLDFNQAKSNVEWRLANGVPFAAIFRAPTYAEGNEFGPGKKTGENLVVIGLKGHDDIEASIDAKTPNANAKAREAADSKFWKKD